MKRIIAIGLWILLLANCKKQPFDHISPDTIDPPPEKPDSVLYSISFSNFGVYNEYDTTNNFIFALGFVTRLNKMYTYLHPGSMDGITADYVNTGNLIDTLGTPYFPGDMYAGWTAFFPVNPKAIDSVAFTLQMKNKTQKMYVTKETQIIGDLRNGVSYRFMANWYNNQLRRMRGMRWVFETH